MIAVPPSSSENAERAATLNPAGRAARLPLHWIGVACLVLLAAYAASGFYTVSADEHGVVRRFGAIAARVGPGIHYRAPWPVDRVDVVKTTSVMKIGVGFTLAEGAANSLEGTELLTGDTNILRVALVVQYVVRDPAQFLFRVEEPQALVASIAQSVLTRTVIGMPVDEVLTTGRLAIQSTVKVQAQAILDRYSSGIQITTANIMNIGFERAVGQAFQEVADAMADREKVQNEARAYENDQIPKARGEATRMVTEAKNYKQQRIAESIGDSNRFLALLKEYEKAPEVTRTRIYLETMEKVLPKVKMYVIDTQNGSVRLNLRLGSP